MAATIIPTFRYRDAPAMLAWLCETFGFERKVVYEDEEGGIAHAELTFGADGMIMLGSVRHDAFGRLQADPARAGGVTQSPYLVVASDVDALYRRVEASGAEIVMALRDQPHGSRDFSCRDPEGHVWNFGTYDPWRA